MILGVAQLPPPNVVENGDAHPGDASWGRFKNHRPIVGATQDLAVEDCDGGQCFVMRNGTAWRQRIHLVEDVSGKYVLIIARGSSERVHPDGNITGLPYLWARLITRPPGPLPGTILQGMRIRAAAPNRWETMHGIFPVPKGAVAVELMLGQAERKGTPQNGSAARVKDVEVRFFDTEAAARAYVMRYDAQHGAVGEWRECPV
jgi:hypothetical protein